MNQIELGKFINKLRTEANLTQDELAEKVGVSSGKIVSKWENGYTLPDIFTLKKLSKILNVTLYELTECKKLEKKKLVDATKNYIKSSSDIFKLNIIGKVTIVIAILLGIFFGLSSIYFFDNYNKDIIYNIESLNKDFAIRGKIILTKKYNSFDLLDVYCINENKQKFNINAHNIEYHIINKKEYKLLTYVNRLQLDGKNDSQNLLDNIKKTKFSILLDENTKKEFELAKSNTLFLQISYENDNNEITDIKIPLKLIKKYQNTFTLFY